MNTRPGPEFTTDDARRFYDRFGRCQDWQRFYEAAAERELLARLDLRRARSILEFGCGTGRFAERILADHLSPDARYLGLDLSGTMATLSGARLAHFGERARARQTDGGVRFELPRASFDRVISLYVLDLLPEPVIREFLDEAHRLLTRDGLLGLVSLTRGRTRLSRLVERAWTAIHRRNPALVGGCRPIVLEPLVARRYAILHRRIIVQRAVPSEVLVARPA